MSKPVELIVANLLHGFAEAMEQVPPAMRATVDMASLAEDITRKALCHIAHDASMAVVVTALEAAGVAGGVDGLAGRFAAVREARAEEGCTAAAPAEAKPAADSAQVVAEFLRKLFGPNVNITAVKRPDGL
jgi:hypothetical protein